MEAYLIENESVLSLKGLNEVTIIESEVSLIDGRADKLTDGRIDILAKYGQEYLAVVELKKGELNFSHLTQLESYLREHERILAKFPRAWDYAINPTPRWLGVMIGESINPDLMLKIRNGYSYNGNIPIAALTINRYRGRDGNVYIITDTYFAVTGKDFTQYLFNGKLYGKGRLVLAVMKEHVQNNPDVSYSRLEADFPHVLQGKDSFTDYATAMAVYSSSGRKRHFIEPEELISLKDGTTIAVSREWGVNNIGKFIAHAQSLGYAISF